MRSDVFGKLGLAVLCAFLVVGLAASVVAAAAQEVAIVVKIAGIPWFNRMAVGVEEAGRALGIRAFLTGPSTADAAAQVAMVEDLVSRGIGAIGVVPTDAKALAPVFNRARQKGIIVLTHESPFETEAIDYDIETIDSAAYGRMAVDEMVAGLRRAGVSCTAEKPCGFVMLVGGLTVPLHNYWADVALQYVRTNYPQLRELTSRLPTAESVEDSRRAVLDLMRAYGSDLNGVIGWGSLGPLGAAAAVRERGMQRRIIVGGSAIPSSAVAYLADGSMTWAQLWDPKDAGFAMVYIAKQLLDGRRITPGMEIAGLGPVGVEGKVVSVNRTLLMRSADDARRAGF